MFSPKQLFAGAVAAALLVLPAYAFDFGRPANPDEIKLWNQVLKLYRAQDWDQAELQLFNLQKLSPDLFLYKLYAERITEYRKNPPGDNWDGVTTFETK